MISKKLAIGYYGVPFNLVIVVTDLITIMVKKEHDLLAKAFIVVLTVFRYVSVVKLLSSTGFTNMIVEYFDELRKSVIHHSPS